jgi:predicted RNase H-like nuclease
MIFRIDGGLSTIINWLIRRVIVMALIAGAAGCRGGWLESGIVTSEVHSSAYQLIYESTRPDVLAIDIPMRLADSGLRRCGVVARKMLGHPRGSSVFPAPIRPALAALNRREADLISRSVDGKCVGAQAFALYRRIHEIDDIIRSSVGLHEFIYEVHPELCFTALNKGKSIQESKKSSEGMCIRLDLIQMYFGEDAINAVRRKHLSSQVKNDDIYDAFAALWTAERIILGAAEVIPNPPDKDSFGLKMAIWF